MDLKDKVVVITGASKGLGVAIAKAISKEGCKIVVSATSKDLLDKIALEINGYAVKADVRDEHQMIKLAEQTIQRFGKIDIWINNAGVRIPHSNLEEIDWNRAHNMMEVNYFGTAYGSKAALKYMKTQKSGIIVNILSTSALEGRPRSSAYAASKGAAKGFTESIRNEVKEDNITVISVYPGGMKTEFFNEQIPENYDKYMDPESVAQKIIENLKKEKPEEELILKRPS
jgi:short-subunit dehydrogenase